MKKNIGTLIILIALGVFIVVVYYMIKINDNKNKIRDIIKKCDKIYISFEPGSDRYLLSEKPSELFDDIHIVKFQKGGGQIPPVVTPCDIYFEKDKTLYGMSFYSKDKSGNFRREIHFCWYRGNWYFSYSPDFSNENPNRGNSNFGTSFRKNKNHKARSTCTNQKSRPTENKRRHDNSRYDLLVSKTVGGEAGNTYQG